MKKTPQKPDPVVKVSDLKMTAKKSLGKASFSKFMPNRERNKNNSSVGPSWGGRKGN